MAYIKGLDAHERPPESIRQAFKKYRKLEPSDIDSDPGILDLHELDADVLPDGLCLDGWLSGESLGLTFDAFMNRPGSHSASQPQSSMRNNVPVYVHHAVPGQRRQSTMYEGIIFVDLC
jgi:hypothetical protein